MERTNNRQDEWRIEQGLTAQVLPVLDQSGPEPKAIPPGDYGWKEWKDEATINAIGDPEKLFVREKDGWVGFVSCVPTCAVHIG